MNKYYVVTNRQIFISSILISIIVFCLITINNRITDYFQLPLVMVTSDKKCVTVVNVKNGENFNCSDVDVTLKNYRVQING